MGESTNAEPQYIPAARWQAFSRVYDPVLAPTMRERTAVERYERLRTAGGSLDLLAAG